MHDLRFFFQNGLNLEKTSTFQSSNSSPKSFESALSMIFNILLHTTSEIDESQTVDYFNIFLAPFIKNMEQAKIKETLRLFLTNVNQHAPASLGLELTIPDFIADELAFEPSNVHVGKYGDFVEESQTLALLLLDIFAEENAARPLFNPKIIIKTRPETFTNEAAKRILSKAHQLSSQRGILYYSNLTEKKRKHLTFSASGFNLDADPDGDWEIDTLRTGCLGCVTVNMPRIANDCGKEKKRFFELLAERLEMAARALEIKERALKQRGSSLLPFVMQSTNGDHYFRLENCSRIINLAGLKEAVESFNEKSFTDDRDFELLEETIQNVQAFTQRINRKHGKRLSATMIPDAEASERLVHVDIEKYGIGKVRFSGTREKPFYSTVDRLFLKDGEILPGSLKFGEKTRALHGGNLTVVELGDAEVKADQLLMVTKQLFESYQVGFLTYNRRVTYCTNCKKSWFGLLHKCPSCGSISTLIPFDNYALA
jgi:ribonucleoside-triphosphate reductase